MATTFRERLEDIPDRVLLAETTRVAEPHALLEELRQQWGPLAPVDLEPGVPGWLVLGHREVGAVLRNELVYSRSSRAWRYVAERRLAPDSALLALLAPRENAYYLDGSQQRRLRAALDDAFAGLDEARLARTIAVTADAVLDKLVARGEADLVREYAVAVTVLVLGEMLGLSLTDALRMHDLAEAKHRSLADARAASDEQLVLLMEHVAAHRAEPRDDLTTAFLDHPNHVDDFEVLAAVALVFDIAHDAEIAWIASTLHLILEDPLFAARVHGGRLGLEEALEESARVRPPFVNVLPRFVLQDTELGGRHVARGDAVVPSLMGAGVDQAALGTGDLWLEAGNRFQLTWGAGGHTCPAHRAGSLIGRIAVEAVLHRMPGMTLAVPAQDVRLTPSPWARYPTSLPIRLAVPDDF